VLSEDYAVIDIGAYSTTVGLFSVDMIANASIQISYGGERLTQTIVERLSLTPEEAEIKKRVIGLNTEQEDTGVPAILRECLQEIINKVNEAKHYFEEKTGSPIKHVIITGGTALLPNIQAHFAEQMGVEVEVAKPLQRVNNQEVFEKDTPEILFSNVIGLSLYGNSTDRSRINLLTQYRYDDGGSLKETLRIRDIRSVGDLKYFFYSLLRRKKKFIAPILNYLVKMKAINLKLVFSLLFFIATIALLFFVISKYI